MCSTLIVSLGRGENEIEFTDAKRRLIAHGPRRIDPGELAARQLDPLTTGPGPTSTCGSATTPDVGAKPSTICRRLFALSNWYRYLAAHDVLDHTPVAGVQQAAGAPLAPGSLRSAQPPGYRDRRSPARSPGAHPAHRS